VFPYFFSSFFKKFSLPLGRVLWGRFFPPEVFAGVFSRYPNPPTFFCCGGSPLLGGRGSNFPLASSFFQDGGPLWFSPTQVGELWRCRRQSLRGGRPAAVWGEYLAPSGRTRSVDRPFVFV